MKLLVLTCMLITSATAHAFVLNGPMPYQTIDGMGVNIEVGS